jgi:CheY-like chemotaxis protein
MKNLHLLLVEDNEGDVVLAQEALDSVSTKVLLDVAEDGHTALEKLNNQSPNSDLIIPDAIILDINLPGMNGKELLRILKSNVKFKKIPIIIFSTTSSPSEIREVYELKASWYATKPDKLKDYVKLMKDIEFRVREKQICTNFDTFIIS